MNDSYIDKFRTTPIDLQKLSNVVKIEIVKNTLHIELVKKVNASQTTDTSSLFKKPDYDTAIDQIERKTCYLYYCSRI